MYLQDLLLTVPIMRPDAAQSVTLEVRYQGCSETFNICYPPETKTVSLALPAMTSQDSPPVTTANERISPVDMAAGSSDQDKISIVVYAGASGEFHRTGN